MELIDTWIPIIGYESYQINMKRKLVRNNKDHILKALRGVYIRLYDNNGGTASHFHINKLIYAALKNVNPYSLYDKGLQVMEKDGELILMTRKQLYDYVNKKIVRKKSRPIDLESEYEKIIGFSNTALESIRSGDFSQVVTQMYNCKEAVQNYMRINHNIRNATILDEHWENIIDIGIFRFTNKKQVIYEPKVFLIGITSRYLKMMVKERKTLRVGFREDLLSRDTYY